MRKRKQALTITIDQETIDIIDQVSEADFHDNHSVTVSELINYGLMVKEGKIQMEKRLFRSTMESLSGNISNHRIKIISSFNYSEIKEVGMLCDYVLKNHFYSTPMNEIPVPHSSGLNQFL